MSLEFRRVLFRSKIISDKTYCLDRADKIFINQVWETLGEVLSYDKEDEKGNLVEVKVDPEDYVFPVDRIIPDILNPAFEATEDIIQEGYWEINGATCEVTAEPLSSDDVRRIIDFPVINDSLSGFGYKISKTAFRNIFEKAIELAPEEETINFLIENGLLRFQKGYLKKLHPQRLVYNT